MVVLVYLTLVPLECYSWSTDVIIKTKLTRDRNKCMEVFCKKDIFKNLKKFTKTENHKNFKSTYFDCRIPVDNCLFIAS